jgi:hypothetical protein
MAIHWFIDGNNLLHLLPEVKWAPSTASALAAALKPYRDAKGLVMTIFFDGGDAAKNSRLSGIPVVYAGPEKSADEIILERIKKHPGGNVGLVSNDAALTAAASALGARCVSAFAFAGRLGQGPSPKEERGWNFTTVKKGPSRRLPRSRRAQNRIMDKF